MKIITYKSLIGNLNIEYEDEKIFKIYFDNSVCVKKNYSKFEKNILNQMNEYFLGKRKTFNLKYELIGTNFQKRVWIETKKISYGTTNSYKDIAIKLKNEKAYRAVANALSKNKILLIIPCHRVIGNNKKLYGFNNGIKIKKFLLQHELSHLITLF